MTESGSSSASSLDPSGWVDQYGDTLFRYALSRLRNAELAEETVQETFLAALRARAQFAGRGSEGAWLLGILKRKIIDLVRRRSRPDTAVGQDDGYDPTNACFDAQGNWRFDPRFSRAAPEANLDRQEFWDVLRHCLDGLSQRQADVFTLREIDDMASEQICKELEISSSNLWVLLHRARLNLTRCLKSHWDD